MNSREERMLRGRALYLSVYESQGAIWEANECKELWCEKADRYLELAGNGNAQRPLQTALDQIRDAIEAYGLRLVCDEGGMFDVEVIDISSAPTVTSTDQREAGRVEVTDGSVQQGDIITYALTDEGLGKIISHARPVTSTERGESK